MTPPESNSPQEPKDKIVHVHLPADAVYETTLTAGRHELTSDEPETVEGGRDTGPDPYDYLLMSLGSCTAMTLKMYARRKEWPLEEVYLELRHHKRHAEDCENCDDAASKMDHIEVELILKGDLDEAQRERLLEISERCPVHRTLKGEIQIENSLGS
ncbi:MAG: OsmC family protein [Balneolaceae bacterium]|nr:OsmC family protein [Balneolaceae bacterium]